MHQPSNRVIAPVFSIHKTDVRFRVQDPLPFPVEPFIRVERLVLVKKILLRQKDDPVFSQRFVFFTRFQALRAQQAHVVKSPFAKGSKRVLDLNVVNIAILVDDEQIIAVVSKKRKSLFDFQTPFNDDQIFFPVTMRARSCTAFRLCEKTACMKKSLNKVKRSSMDKYWMLVVFVKFLPPTFYIRLEKGKEDKKIEKINFHIFWKIRLFHPIRKDDPQPATKPYDATHIQ